jgi:phosphoglycolate phosphatase-like HAD superfamily hydrolase
MIVKNVKGIVWDLDGTLLDSFSIFRQVIGDVVVESGHAMPSLDFMLTNFHGSLEETVQRLLGINSAAELDKVITAFLEKQERYYAGDLETHLFKDASMLARQAAKQSVHQLLITNRAHAGRGSASPRFIIAATFLADCIHEVYPSDEVSYRKPDKRSLGDWMEQYKLTPAEIVVIGDQFVDAQLACNVGARAILVKRNGAIPHLDSLTTVSPNDVIIVDSLDEIELATN